MKFNNFVSSLLIQLLLLFENAESQNPTITRAPNATTAVEKGERVTLEWTYDLHGIGFRKAVFSTPGVLFIAEKSNSDLAPLIRSEYRGRITANITETYSSVTFLSANVTDSKIYGFFVQNANGDDVTKSVEMIVQIPPHITHISGNQTVIEGDEVTLNCTADGNPAPSITWTRLSNDSHVNMPLQHISRQAKGGYRCTADNAAGSPATKDTFITVQCECSKVLIGALS